MIERSRPVDGAGSGPALTVANGRCIAHCADGSALRILVASIDGERFDEAALAARLGPGAHRLG